VIHTDLGVPAFSLPPLAPHTGPFSGRAFLETWWRHREDPDARLLVAADDRGLVPTVLSDGTLLLCGDADVTDYHTPRGEVTPELVRQLAAATGPGTPFRFDSLPAEAATAVETAVRTVADDVETAIHETAAVLTLPPSFHDWLMAIGKKERHETRRKRRRFTAELGEPKLQRMLGPEAVDTFVEMHRKARGDKGDFMDDRMAGLFADLHTDVGGAIDMLSGDDDRPVAAAFGFEDPAGYYLYNSAYDPAAGSVSPGVVLIAMLIEQTIDSGLATFDFLKGDETYKFRLGAEERPLHVVSGRFRSV
jgi:CelD/BcsL family acetyltransferase involved in cellulose biosynthesis